MNKLKNYVVFSTFYAVNGEPADGYSVYITPYLNALAETNNVFAFGISYDRKEHYWNFGVEACRLEEIPHIMATLLTNLEIEGLIIALDVNWIIQFAEMVFSYKKKTKFIAISAIESDPLITPIAMKLFNFDKFIAISKFGEEQTKAVGLNSLYLPAIYDPVFTRKTSEEQKELKNLLGLENKIVFFTNADLNERKNLGLIFETLPLVIAKHPDIYWLLLTRRTPLGWDLDELMLRFNLQNKVNVLNRTFTRKELRNYYVVADLVLNPSKAGGLELAIIEAQLVGTPVMATNCSGMSENLVDGLGIPLPWDYRLLDIFMNQYRYLVSKETLAAEMIKFIENLKNDPNYYDDMVERAYRKHLLNDIKNCYPLFENYLNG